MKLNLKTDYAFRILIYLKNQDQRATIKEIAEFYDVNKNHLSVIVNQLSELGYIHSIPGPGGGISLNPQTLNKKLSEIMLNFEQLDLVECFNKDSNKCLLNPSCKLKGILRSASRNFLDTLAQHKLKDL